MFNVIELCKRCNSNLQGRIDNLSEQCVPQTGIFISARQ
jgi:hypothetical protein